MTRSKFIISLFYLILALTTLVIADLCFGSVNLFALESSDPLFETILYDIRLPKTLTAMIAGSGLALCGLLMQTLFRNPLAGPYVLGVSSGASMFVAIAIMLISSTSMWGYFFMGKGIITLFSIMGALFVTLNILMVSKKTKSNVTVLLVGIMLSQILGAIEGVIQYVSSADSVKTFIMWGMGSVGSTTMEDLLFVAPIFAITVFACFFFIKPLNAILLNEQYAQNLGINVSKLRFSIIILTAVLVGLITAFCGPIAFVGISVPIASRLFFKTSHHLHQMIFCLLLGACVVLLADVVCQVMSNQFVLPINTVTTIIGSPVVIYLLFKSKLSLG